MRGWLLLGVILAVSGTLLLFDGISQRFGGDSNGLDLWSEIRNTLKTSTESQATVEPADTNKSNEKGKVTLKRRIDKPSKKGAKLSQTSSRKKVTAAKKRGEKARIKRDNRYKKMLVEDLLNAGWSEEEIADLKSYMDDPRSSFLPGVLEVNATHVETKKQYAQHLTEASLEMCRTFWEANDVLLNEGAGSSAVPVPIIVAIMKVETNFGKTMGTRSVFNVFWSLSLADRPEVLKESLSKKEYRKVQKEKKMLRRAHWARSQLRDLIYMGGHHGEDPVGIIGSWAGAFGLSQFIPTSYRAYGKDGNKDGVIDLDDVTDAAASIAFYLEENGWKKDGNKSAEKRVIMRYNHSEYYADCVLAIADSLGSTPDGSSMLQ